MGKRGPQGNGIEVREHSIRMRFQFAGRRLSEPLPLAPTRPNVRLAEHMGARIRVQIEHGVFDWREYFPDSKHAAFYEANPCTPIDRVRLPARVRAIGIVYVIRQQTTGAMKVGYTGNRDRLRRRVAALSVGSPYPLHILHSFPGTPELEREIHEALAAHRLGGEWFSDVPAVREYLWSREMEATA